MLNLPVLCLSTIEKESSLADLPFFLTYQHYDFIKYFNRRCKPSSSSSVFKIQNIRSGCSLLSTMEIISPSLQGKTSFFKKTLQTLSCILVKLCIIQHGGRGSRTSKHTLHGRIGCQPDIPALFNFVRLKPPALHCLANGFSIRQSPFIRCLCKCQHLIQIDPYLHSYQLAYLHCLLTLLQKYPSSSLSFPIIR